MKIKKFQAKSLRDAMDMARKEFGDDAVILNTRETRPSDASGRTIVELVAALDEEQPAAETTKTAINTSASGGEDIASEIAALRAAVESLVGEEMLLAHTRPKSSPERRLRDAGVEPALASQIARSIQAAESLDDLADQWACLFTCAAPQLRQDGPTVIALTGPSGSGKTTTLAKMAASFRFEHAKSVAAICCDGLRIGAKEMLETLSQAIGAQYRSCIGAADLSATIDELSETDVILIDTPGGSYRNPDYVSEIRQLLQDERITSYLLLPANQSADSRADCIKAFSVLDPQRVVITKMDESPSMVPALAISQATPVALAFLTNSPDIPGNLEIPTSGSLSSAVIEDLLA